MKKTDLPIADIARRARQRAASGTSGHRPTSTRPIDRAQPSSATTPRVNRPPNGALDIELGTLESQDDFPVYDSILAPLENVLEMVSPDRLDEMYVRLMAYHNTLLALRAERGRD